MKAMNTAQGWYWIALGVLALGLSSEYRNGNLPAVERVVAQTESAVCQVAARAEQSFAEARLLVDDGDQEFLTHEAAFPRDLEQQALTREDAGLARAQARLDRMRASLERVRAVQVREFDRAIPHLAAAETRQIVVVCPHTGQRVVMNVPALPEARRETLETQIDTSF
jgi:hypothetical protein